MSRLPKVKVKGARGNWTADVDGERLPVIHNTWFRPDRSYFDPMVDVNTAGKRYQDYVALLRETDRVVMQRDKDPKSLGRDGYIGVFRFNDLEIQADGAVSLTVTERVANIRK